MFVTRHDRGGASVIGAAPVDPGVCPLILTGTGGTFCAGADLSDPPKNGPTRGPAVLRTLWTYPKPV